MKRVTGALSSKSLDQADSVAHALDVLRKHVITKCPNAMLAGVLHKALDAMENLR